MLRKIIKNAHIRLFFTGSFFAVAFVCMAIYSYGVDIEVIKVFLILSFMFVAALIGIGFAFSLLIRAYRHFVPYSAGSSLLDGIEEVKAEKSPDKKEEKDQAEKDQAEKD